MQNQCDGVNILARHHRMQPPCTGSDGLHSDYAGLSRHDVELNSATGMRCTSRQQHDVRCRVGYD